MDVELKKGIVKGTAVIPSSKSYCHRFIVAGIHSIHPVKIENVNLCEDVQATIECLKKMGANIEIENTTVFIQGYQKVNQTPILDAKESGSTLRFLIPCALALYNHVIFKMCPRLFERGIALYEELFKEKGIQVIKDETNSTIELIGFLRNGNYTIKGNESSQYISGLLLALPYIEGDSLIHILPPIESSNYIDLTLDVLHRSGIQVVRKDNTLLIPGSQKGQMKNEVVEIDYSNAAFFHCYNYLGGKVTIPFEDFKTLQNDCKYKEYFEELSLGFQTIDLKDNIDLGPVLFAFAALKKGGRFINTSRLAMKESNRCEAMALELKKMNINLDVKENEVVVFPSDIKEPSEAFDSHNDHRIVMALCLFVSKFDLRINHFEAVQKSFPMFFDCLKKCGIEVEYVRQK